MVKSGGGVPLADACAVNPMGRSCSKNCSGVTLSGTSDCSAMVRLLLLGTVADVPRAARQGKRWKALQQACNTTVGRAIAIDTGTPLPRWTSFRELSQGYRLSEVDSHFRPNASTNRVCHHVPLA